MPRGRQQNAGLPAELASNPDSLGEHIKTAIDEDWMAFVFFGLSVIGSICCWSGCLVMPEWIYWGDKIHGLSFEISGPLFALWAGFTYIRGTGARDRMTLLTAERLAGAAVTLQLACWYLINLRTLKVRIDVNDLSSEYTEEAYTYYYFGCVLNFFAMVFTLRSIFIRSKALKTEETDSKALDTEWASRKAEGAKSPTSGGAPASVSDDILDDDEEGLLEPASL